MICAAVNGKDSFGHIDRWRTEIQQVCSQAPIILILTKSDLTGMVDENDEVTFEMMKQKSQTGGFQGACQTSSKEWEDFNVHKAFTKALITG